MVERGQIEKGSDCCGSYYSARSESRQVVVSTRIALELLVVSSTLLCMQLHSQQFESLHAWPATTSFAERVRVATSIKMWSVKNKLVQSEVVSSLILLLIVLLVIICQPFGSG